MDNLLRDLQDAWRRDGESPAAGAALQRWAGRHPGLARYATPAQLVRASHSRADADAERLVAAITEEAPADPWATRTVLQALLPGLARIARQHYDDDSVLTNHGTKLFFSGISDPATLDYVSRLLGDEEVIQRGASNDVNFGRRSVNESATRLRLVPADILRQVPPGEGLLIHGTLRPAHLKGRFYYAEKHLRRLAGEESVAAAAAALGPPPAAPAAEDNASALPTPPASSLPVTTLGGGGSPTP